MNREMELLAERSAEREVKRLEARAKQLSSDLQYINQQLFLLLAEPRDLDFQVGGEPYRVTVAREIKTAAGVIDDAISFLGRLHDA